MTNLTKEQFEIYCMLYAASIDLDVTQEEKNAIKAEVEPKDFDIVYNLFDSQSDKERADFLAENKKKYIKNAEELELIISCIKDVIESDSKVSMIERGFLSIIRRLLAI